MIECGVSLLQLMDQRFAHVLTPFEPLSRDSFCRSMAKSSTVVTRMCTAELTRMRDAVETCYQCVDAMRNNHLRCIRAIKVAESSTAGQLENDNAQSGSDDAKRTSSATAHEAAQRAWHRFLQYADSAGDRVQVGFVLVDQQELMSALRQRISDHIAAMNAALPKEYQDFLQALIDDVNGRIERVTTVPVSLEDTNVWLAQLTEMLPTHMLRLKFDAECQNLARLKALVKERVLQTAMDPELQNEIHKLEVSWDSLYETLLMCLERVQDRNSVHRRSVDEITAKTEENISAQLRQILAVYASIPTGFEQIKAMPDSAHQLTTTSYAGHSKTGRLLIGQLEELVELDLERSRVMIQYAAYEREYRMVTEVPQAEWVSTLSSNRASEAMGEQTITEKLPTEMLLQYVVTALEVRQWFASWISMRSKWLVTPVVQVHPGVLADRIRQFRKRLSIASSRIFRLSGALLKSTAINVAASDFAAPDIELVQAFSQSIDEMTTYSKLFQAVNGGSFGDQHWETLESLLAQVLPRQSGERLNRGAFSLQAMLNLSKVSGRGAAGVDENVMVFVDQCIVETRLHAMLERSRQRLSRLRVQIYEENYCVRCDGIEDALRELDDILVDVKLCLYQQNPELQQCMSTCTEIERDIAICEHIVSFQHKWLPVFDVLKLHDMEEFVASHEKQGLALGSGMRYGYEPGEEGRIWQVFVGANQRWSDCMRRIFFAKPAHVNTAQDTLQDNGATLTEAFSNATTTASKNLSCSMEDVARVFEGFDFDAHLSACENGMKLVRGYLAMLRGKSPRLYLVGDADLMTLVTHDQDVQHLHHVLTRCFPHVPWFSVTRCSPQHDPDLLWDDDPPSTANAPSSIDSHANEQHTAIVIGGITDTRDTMSWPFRAAVTKIGRVKFWLTRIDEEMAQMVRTNLKFALKWAMSCNYVRDFVDNSVCLDVNPATCASSFLLFPQSVAAASTFRFSHEVEGQWLRRDRGNVVDLNNHLVVQTQELVSVLHDVINANRNSPIVRWRIANIENLVLLNRFHSEVTARLTHLLNQGREEDARFFWNLQFKVNLCIASAINAGGRAGQHAEKVELPEELDSAMEAMKLRDMDPVEVYAQVAHVDLALGREFTGWGRLPVVSPLATRCAFAIFSALRTHKTAPMLAPYSSASNDKFASTSLVETMARVLMVPLVHCRCEEGSTLFGERLGSLIDAAIGLNALLVLDNFINLGQSTQRLIHQQLVDRFKPETLTNLHSGAAFGLAGMHISAVGGPPRFNSGVVVPFSSAVELGHTGLLEALQHGFRPIAIPPIAIAFLVESLLLTHGFSADQIRRSNVVLVFEVLASFGFNDKCGVDVRAVIPRVISEAMRLRAGYCLRHPDGEKRHLRGSADDHNMAMPHQTHEADALLSCQAEILETRLNQIVFRTAMVTSIELLAEEQCASRKAQTVAKLSALVDNHFPLANGQGLCIKIAEEDGAVASAVAICLEELHFATAGPQLTAILDLWKALQCHDGVIVHGQPGSGKSACVKILHRALIGLALASSMDGSSRATNQLNRSPHSQEEPTFKILNPAVLTLDQLQAQIGQVLRSRHALDREHRQQFMNPEQPKRVPPHWVIVDGELDSAMLERLVTLNSFGECEGERDLAGSALYQFSRPLDGTCSRLLFETTSLRHLSPLTLATCASVHVSHSCITYESIVRSWKLSWQQRLRVAAISRDDAARVAPLNMLFKIVDQLIRMVCIPFMVIENDQELGTTNLRCQQLGGLSLNHLTSATLSLLPLWCFPRQLWRLDEMPSSPAILAQLVAFSVLWGFTGHLQHALQHKFEFFLRAKVKDMIELRHLNDVPGSLFDAARFDEWWNDEWATTTTSSTPQSSLTHGSAPPPQSLFDPLTNQFIVIQPAAAPLARVCSQLLHSSKSFILTGPPASGKTSVLRWLLCGNYAAQAAEIKVDKTLDQRQASGILDWLAVPPTWFRPTTAAETDVSVGHRRARAREEDKLFAPRSVYSFVFLDDLAVHRCAEAAADSDLRYQVSARDEVMRSILDHGVCYSRLRDSFVPVDKQIGASMTDRSNGPRRGFPDPISRLLRHFIVLHAPEYSTKDLLSVFRVKFHAYFTDSGYRDGNSSRNLSDSSALPAEEVLLRASTDLMAEVSTLCESLRSQGGVDAAVSRALTFNWHSVALVLQRSLEFASSLGQASGSSIDSNGGEKAAISLVDLGRLHQSWLSELQHVFLINWPLIPVTTCEPGLITDTEQVAKKLWAAVRLLGEKYFSVSVQDERTLPVSIASAYFTLRLAGSHPMAPLLLEPVMELRNVLTALASSAGSLGRRRGSTLPPSPGVVGEPEYEQQQSIPEQIAALLLEMASQCRVRQSQTRIRTPALSDIGDVELQILLASPPILTQALHVIHALGAESRAQVVVLSTRHGAAMARRLASFGCRLHGFHMHRVGNSERGIALRELLLDVLHRVGVRNERVALFIDWEHTAQRTSMEDRACEIDLLVEFLTEICLEQMPSLVLDQGHSTDGSILRDAILLGCVQSRHKLEVMTEADVARDLHARLRRNLRVCVFDSTSESDSTERDMWSTVRSRATCRWLSLDLVHHDVDRSTTAMISAAIPLLVQAPSEHDSIIDDKVVTALHHQAMNHIAITQGTNQVDAMAPEHHVEYLLSFLLNLVSQWRLAVEKQRQMMERYQYAVDGLDLLVAQLAPRLAAKRQALDARLSELGGDSDDQFNASWIKEMEDITGRTELIDPEYAAWCCRVYSEERAMMRCEIATERQALEQFESHWHQASALVARSVSKWRTSLMSMKSLRYWKVVASEALVTAMRVTHSFIWSFSGSQRQCMEDAERILHDHSLRDDEQELLDDSKGKEGRDCSLDPFLSDGETAALYLARLLSSASLPLVHCDRILKTIEASDQLCNRVPVLMDPTGTVQRFLVRCFSGWPMLPSASTGDGVRSKSTPQHLPPQSCVISCEAADARSQLLEAQQLKMPVLLLDFRPTVQIRALLAPFIADRCRPQRIKKFRAGVIERLVVGAYHGLSTDRNARRTNRRTASITIGSATVSLVPRLSVTAGATATVALPSTTTPSTDVTTTRVRRDTADKRADQPSTSSGHEMVDVTMGTSSRSPWRGKNEFQIVAVASTAISLSTQHDWAADFGFFMLDATASELEHDFLPRASLAHSHPSSEQRIHDARRLVADACAHTGECQDQLWAAITSKHATLLGTTHKMVAPSTLEHFERVTDLMAKLEQHDRRLAMTSEQLVRKQAAFDEQLADLRAVGAALAPLGNCIAATLSLLPPSSTLYNRNYRWIEYCMQRELARTSADTDGANGVRSKESATVVTQRITSSVTRGLVSSSHRRAFAFFRAIAVSCGAGDNTSFLKLTVAWLASNMLSWGSTDAAIDHPEPTVRPIESTTSSTPASGPSLVERFRRKVRLGVLLVGHTRHPGLQQQRHRAGRSMRLPQRRALRPNLARPSNASQQHGRGADALETALTALFAAAEELWNEWKATKAQRRRDVERLLLSHGVHSTQHTAPGSSETNVGGESSWCIRIQSLRDVLRKFPTSECASEADNTLVELLLTLVNFPDRLDAAVGKWCDFQLGSDIDRLEGDEDDASAANTKRSAAFVADVVPPISTRASAASKVALHLPQGLFIHSTDSHQLIEKWLYPAQITAWAADLSTPDVLSRIVALVSAKQRFALQILSPEQFDVVTALVSRAINDHALLAVPEWFLLCSLRVAMQIKSAKLALMPRIAVVGPKDPTFGQATGSFSRDARRRLIDHGGASESHAAGLMSAFERRQHHPRSDMQLPAPSVVGEFKQLVELSSWLPTSLAASGGDQTREQLESTLRRCVDLPDVGDGEQTGYDATQLVECPAAVSADLAVDLVRLHQPLLGLVDDSSTSTDTAVDKVMAKAMIRTAAVFDALRLMVDSLEDATMALTRAASPPAPALFPWLPFHRELAAQLTFFRSLDAQWTSVNSGDSTDSAVTMLVRGFVPFKWLERTQWPHTHVAVAQLVLLLAFRLGLLADWLVARAVAPTLDLAAVHDAGGLLCGLKRFAATQWGVSERDVVLELAIDEEDEEDEGEDDSSPQYHGAFISSRERVGLQVDGLVLLQSSTPTELSVMHHLPATRLLCRRRENDEDGVPLVLLPSLSPFQTNVADLLVLDRVTLAFDPRDVVSTHQPLADGTIFTIGAPLLSTDD